MDKKRTGSVAELAVATKLAELGFTVSWPLIEDSYDLIAEKDGHSRRVQVKSANINKGGSYRCTLAHGSPARQGYTKNDCDVIVLHAPYSRDFNDIIFDGFYIVPVENVAGHCTAVIFPAGKGKGNIRVCKWEKFKDGWDKI